ncbi:hypothetical protein [Tardiphaga robiniae]|uniref:Uncharacterized protein n=1 Tax=Tardiphaga robiniae TaxID=943830 RepID=A0A163Y6G7_9BRAD|nr:hypothetical protein [Tardiphaga robiniae]KZD21865.1 hypothetical protein A4A58_12175 [Tardiphaga robiniae]
MSTTASDPPGAERNTAKFWKWVRARLRKLVTRKTLLIALSIIVWADRFFRAMKRLFGDL